MPKISIEVDADTPMDAARLVYQTAKTVLELTRWSENFGDNADAALATHLKCMADLHALDPNAPGKLTFTPAPGVAKAEGPR